MTKHSHNKDELVITALRQRIGELTSDYEHKLAEIRADATIRLAQLQEENRRLNELLAVQAQDDVPDTV